MTLAIVTPPAKEPIELAETKEWIKVEVPDDDQVILGLLQGARESVENHTNRALITQTWKLYLDRFCNQMDIPLGSLQSVTAVKYVDSNGVEQTLDSSVYDVDTNSDPGRITIAYGQSWPSSRAVPHAINIEFVAGYGDEPSDVPEVIRAAVKMTVAHWHSHRHPFITGTIITEVPETVAAMLWPYRIWLA